MTDTSKQVEKRLIYQKRTESIVQSELTFLILPRKMFTYLRTARLESNNFAQNKRLCYSSPVEAGVSRRRHLRVKMSRHPQNDLVNLIKNNLTENYHCNFDKKQNVNFP